MSSYFISFKIKLPQHHNPVLVGQLLTRLQGLPIFTSQFTKEEDQVNCVLAWCIFSILRHGFFYGTANSLGLWGQTVRRADLAALKLRWTLSLKLWKTDKLVGRETGRYINPRPEHLPPHWLLAVAILRCHWWQSLHVAPQSLLHFPSFLLLAPIPHEQFLILVDYFF